MPKTMILIGAGSRGRCYTDKIKDMDGYFKLVAVAEPINDRREYIKNKHDISESMCFESWESLLDMPKMADIAVIATMDRDHVAPALAAINKGYNLLLEKPAGATPEECAAIQKAAHENGVFVLVCHVLRYTKFWKTLRLIIDSGEIGKVMHIQHIEPVGVIHQSHSFVRGNWRNSDESSPMILQKTCHDMDILSWIINKKCKRVQSFGGLTYFTAANAPKDAPEYCIDGCPHSATCPYDAVKVYYNDKNNSWFRTTSTKCTAPTDTDVEKAIRTTDYGKCVFKCPNNVVDHQVVNLEFEDSIIASFTMSAFAKGGRTITIGGTHGIIEASMSNPIIKVHNYINPNNVHEIDLNSSSDDTIVGGHGGGDWGILHALKDIFDGVPNSSVCDISESCYNHMVSFAAEESRITGKVVSMEEFTNTYYK